MKLPDLKFETELWEKGYLVIGIDEVGRGAFAGPIFAAGVIFDPTINEERSAKLLSYGINDSKKLKPNERKRLAKIIQKEAIATNISSIDVAEINRIGIGKANHKAMRNVVFDLQRILPKNQDPRTKTQLFVLIDGFRVKNIKNVGLKNQKAIVHGDSISLSIAAASIIAKVARDDYMKKLSKFHPQYNWGKNKGYGTLFHRNVLNELGPTPFHRTDFIENFI